MLLRSPRYHELVRKGFVEGRPVRYVYIGTDPEAEVIMGSIHEVCNGQVKTDTEATAGSTPQTKEE